ncbi:RNA recognition motif domain - like 10 [Theobroma cacao]|nr:RNA recognition motif domain - like 10 [Theobroma cacao]
MGDERRSGRRWLDNLQSLFVDNLSKRLTWLAIKGAFKEYGNVVDVFIPRKVQQDPKREVNFAFVRYRERYELDRALKWGGHQWIDGKHLVVKRAEPMRKGFKDRKIRGLQGKIQKLVFERQGFERRSYKEVVVGKGVMEKEQWKAKLNEKENLEKSLEGMADQKVAPKLRKIAVEQEQRNGDQNGRINVEKMNAHERPNLVKLGTEHRLKSKDNKLVFKDKIPVGDMEWMQRNIMGKLHKHVFPKIVQEELQCEGIRVQVRPAGGLHVVLVFTDDEDKEKTLKDHKEGLNEWFDCLYPCSEKNELCNSKVWVRVEGIPLHLWHHSFFQFLGNSWGSFSKVDRQTELKLRFDQALIQVETTNKANIPPIAKIWSCEKLWELPVHIVKASDIEKMVLTEVMTLEVVDSADSVHHFTCEGENRQECGCCNLGTCKLSLAREKCLSGSIDLERREICEELFLNSNEIDELIKSRLKRQKEGEDSSAALVEREMMGMDLDMAGTKGPHGEEIEKVKGSSYSIGSLVCKMGQKDSNLLEYESWEGRSNSEGELWTDSGLDPKRGVGESSTNVSSGDITQKIKVDIRPERVNKEDENSSSLEAISRQGTKGIGRRVEN